MRSSNPSVVIAADDTLFAAHAEAVVDTLGRTAPELAAALGGAGHGLVPDEEEAARGPSAARAGAEPGGPHLYVCDFRKVPQK